MNLNTRLLILFVFPFFGLNTLFAQQLPLVTELDNSLNETSGLLFINNTLITHNDSGGANELYEVDTNNGSITRTITVNNATNVDWEDLAADDTYIYIGDIGNNVGDRTDLKVYRILISDFLNSDTVTADVINFAYKDQTDFTPNPGGTPTTDYDAEALISYQGNLFIFTKQWTSQNSSVYGLPNTPGTYELNIVDTVSSNGLITGASKSLDGNTIVLSGYSPILVPFVIELAGFSGGLFSNGTTLKTNLAPPTGFSVQIEGITAFSTSEFYLSSENVSVLDAGLYTYTSNALNITSDIFSSNEFYPNPTNQWVYFRNLQSQVQVYNMSGQLLLTESNSTQLNIGELADGVYLIFMTDKTTGRSSTEKLFIRY